MLNKIFLIYLIVLSLCCKLTATVHANTFLNTQSSELHKVLRSQTAFSHFYFVGAGKRGLGTWSVLVCVSSPAKLWGENFWPFQVANYKNLCMVC